RTFMNSSGLAARYLLDRFGVRAERMLVVYDDMDLPLGSLRVQTKGRVALSDLRLCGFRFQSSWVRAFQRKPPGLPWHP
ncbi:MAG: hypothetical protein VW867_07655, partial [Gammaproteobacteria bacterium]